MPDPPPTESLMRSYRVCLAANLVSIVLMFGSALLVGFLSRQFNVAADDDAGWSLLASCYLVATRLAVFVGLPAFLIAFAGMLRFQSWARKLYAFLIFAWGSLLLGFGIFNLPLTWGFASVFSDLGLLTAGAVLALSYMTSISDLFGQKKLAVAANSTELSPA